MKRKLYAGVVTGLVAVMILFSITCSSDSMPGSDSKPPDPVSTSSNSDSTENSVILEYDTPPSPINGFAALQKELVYPESARQNEIEGRVILQTMIGKTGDILEVEVARSLDPACDEAAVNTIRATDWQPALKEGKPVQVRAALPVVFKLK
ncbi:MAG: energy transducer TonB [candidate division KSB1 bacterium]|nr:energy transducer TonB [candidate division KSB1 bacterium]